MANFYVRDGRWSDESPQFRADDLADAQRRHKDAVPAVSEFARKLQLWRLGPSAADPAVEVRIGFCTENGCLYRVEFRTVGDAEAAYETARVTFLCHSGARGA